MISRKKKVLRQMAEIQKHTQNQDYVLKWIYAFLLKIDIEKVH